MTRRFLADGPEKDVIPAKGKSTNQGKKSDDLNEYDDETEKLKTAAKNLLTRKNPASGGPEIDWTPPINVKEQKAVYVGLTQKSIDLAIEKGTIYLKKTQSPNGTWSGAHAVGHAAIGGLTLLECNAPTNDLFVQRAAQFVRVNVQNLDGTYELSLAILFPIGSATRATGH